MNKKTERSVIKMKEINEWLEKLEKHDELLDEDRKL